MLGGIVVKRVCKRRARAYEKEEREREGVRVRVQEKRRDACERASGNAHLCISTHCYIYTYYTVCFFVFLFVSSPLFSIINFPLRSFLSLATFYELAETDLPYSSCPSSFSPSIDTTTSYHRPKAAIEPM